MVIIEGKLKGKDRPRFFRGHAVTSQATREYEKRIKEEYTKQGGPLLETPVRVQIIAYKKIPKSYTKKQIAAIREGQTFPTSKPDLDNIIKILLDGLNGVAYKDDTQVIYVAAKKVFTEQEERLEFEVKEYK